MPFRTVKHLVTSYCLFQLLLLAACNKNDAKAPLLAPSSLIYTPDTAIVLKGVSDTSVKPLINWNGRKGTFSFAGPVPQGVTIDRNSGKISWTSTLPIGTYILPVLASNEASSSDTANYTLTVSGKIITIAGSDRGFSGDGSLAVNAQLNMPFDVTLDAQGNIYIADAGNNRIRKIATDGTIHTIAGDGARTFGGDGGSGLQASLSSPSGIITDDQGNLYITDFGNNRIRKLDANGIIITLAGSDNPTVTNLGDERPATQAWLYLLGGKVALDEQHSLYIPDYGNQRVRKVTPDGIIHTITGTGKWGSAIPDGTGASQAAVSGPCGLYWDTKSSSLYIVSHPGCVIYRLTGGNIYGVAGPTTLLGVWGHGGDGGPALKATFFNPTNTVLDKEGNLFIADFQNNKIRKIDTKGIISTVAGNGTQGTSGDGGPAAAAQLSLPYGLAVDANGDLYIADSYNNRIRKVILH